MIYATIRNFINDNAGDPAWTERPEKPPKRYYIVDQTSGKRVNHVYQSMFAIQSYAPTDAEAYKMNLDVIDLMLERLIELDDVASVKLNSNYRFTDTGSKGYRWQAVFDVTHY